MDERGRGGGSSLCADVNKNSHFQPVCALSERSKHYAQHRGRTTLRYSTGFFLRRTRRTETMRTPSNTAGFWPLHVVFTFWVLRAYRCRVSSYHPQVRCASATAHLVSFHVSPPRGKKKVACARWQRKNPIPRLISLLPMTGTDARRSLNTSAASTLIH